MDWLRMKAVRGGGWGGAMRARVVGQNKTIAKKKIQRKAEIRNSSGLVQCRKTSARRKGWGIKWE